MGGRKAGCYTRTHTRMHAHTHSLPSIVISQDTGKASESGKASVIRHEAQDRTPEGEEKQEGELERGETTAESSAEPWTLASGPSKVIRAGSPPRQVDGAAHILAKRWV